MKNNKRPSNLHAGSPRLTEEIKGNFHPWICQHCGGSPRPGFGSGVLRLTVDRWQECDHNDNPEQKIIVLCEKCSKSIIGPHIRMYVKLSPNAPWPGCMDICVDCDFREGTRCANPAAKWNGGTGVMLTIAKPSTAMVDGRDYCGPVTLWPSAATACKQKKLNPSKDIPKGTVYTRDDCDFPYCDCPHECRLLDRCRHKPAKV